MVQRLYLPLSPPSWNVFYAGQHWSHRRRLAEEWHEQVVVECLRQAIHPVERATLTYDITYTRQGTDTDNWAVKLIGDGLVLAGVLPDDSPRYVPQITIRSRKGKVKETIITIDDTAV